MKWSTASGPTVALASGKLSGLANNTLSSGSAAIANQTARNMYTDWEFNIPVTGGSLVSISKFCTLYIQPSVDATNYPASNRKTNEQLCVFPLASGSNLQRIVRRGIMVSPGSYKVALDNQSGITFPTAAIQVRYIAYFLASA